jgi:hypothetical protein
MKESTERKANACSCYKLQSFEELGKALSQLETNVSSLKFRN